MNTSIIIEYQGARKDDFLELLEQIRRETPMPEGTLPVAGQRHYQAVIYSYLEELLA